MQRPRKVWSASLGQPCTTGPDDPASPAGRRVALKRASQPSSGLLFFNDGEVAITERPAGSSGGPAKWSAMDGSWRTLDLSDVGRLQPLGPLGDLEFHLVALAQALEALGLNCAVVNEHVFAAVVLDETVPLGLVKPLHSSFCHASLPRLFLRVRAPSC